MATTDTYTAESIQVLEWFEAVRKRPGMYVGDTDSPAAVHQLLWEVLGNAVDEHLRARVGSRIAIAIHGARITIEDDGRGIPPDAVEPIVTRFRWSPYQPPHVHLAPGLVGCGVAVVNALSDSFEVATWHAGHGYAQQFARGQPTSPLRHLGPTTRHGTRVTFVPDATILRCRAWNRTTIATMCRQLAALIPGLALILDDDIVRYAGGLRDHLQHLSGDPFLIEPVHARELRDGIGVEVAIAFARDAGAMHGYVNYSAGSFGTHLDGLVAGMRRAFAPRRRWNRRLARQLLAIVHVTLDDPRFGRPTRDWLVNPEVEPVVRDVVERAIADHVERAPAWLDAILLASAPRTK
jgi:DNA gyrase subunit B